MNKNLIDIKKAGLALVLCSGLAVTAVQASDDVRRHGGDDYPIADSVEVSPNAKTIYLSGAVAEVDDDSADEHTVEAYGDTETQTKSALEDIKERLEDQGYDMGDVVKLNAYIATDPDKEEVDFDGFSDAYDEYFGTDDQSNIPARTAISAPEMVDPGMLVEIEVIAAK